MFRNPGANWATRVKFDIRVRVEMRLNLAYLELNELEIELNQALFVELIWAT